MVMTKAIKQGALGTKHLNGQNYFLLTVKPIEHNFQHGNPSTTIEESSQVFLSGDKVDIATVVLLDEKPWFPTWQTYRNSLTSIFYSEVEEFPGYRKVLLLCGSINNVCWIKQSLLKNAFTFNNEDIIECDERWAVQGVENFPYEDTSEPILNLISSWLYNQNSQLEVLSDIEKHITPENIDTVFEMLPKELQESFLFWAKERSEENLFLAWNSYIASGYVSRVDISDIFKSWIAALSALSSQS